MGFSPLIYNRIPDCYLCEGDHFVVIGEIINEMVPVRVLKNNVKGYIGLCFLTVSETL